MADGTTLRWVAVCGRNTGAVLDAVCINANCCIIRVWSALRCASFAAIC